MRGGRTIKVVGVCLGVYVGFYVVMSALSWLIPSSLPRDVDIAQQFLTNRAAYVELKDLLVANPALVDPDLQQGSSPEVWQRYTYLRVKAGVSKAYHTGSDYSFPVAGSGFASKGYHISIVWRESEPEHLIASLDDFRKTTREWEQAYRRLEDNWYLKIVW